MSNFFIVFVLIALSFHVAGNEKPLGKSNEVPNKKNTKWLTDWEVRDSVDGISAACRQHKSGIDQCKYSITVRESLTALTAINVDAEHLSSWMDGFINAKKLDSSIGLNDYTLFITYLFAGASNNRYSTNRSTITQDPDTNEVMLYFRSVDSEVKPKKTKYIPFVSISGYWKFKPLVDGSTEIAYSNFSLPGGYVQSWLSYFYNIGSMEASFNTITAMLAEVKKPEYRNKKLDFIVDGFPKKKESH